MRINDDCVDYIKRIYIVCFFAFCLNMIIPLGVIADSMTYEDNTDRMGMDIQEMPIVLNEKDECSVCAQKCLDTADCKSYTYVKANTQTNIKDKPLCYLKKGVPDATENNDCCSGVKQGRMVIAIPSIRPTITLPIIPTDKIPIIDKIEPSGEFGTQLNEGKEFSIIGSNFGTDNSKIQIGFTKDILEEGKTEPRIPPRTENLLYQINETDSSLNVRDTHITADAPSNLESQSMWIWVYKENAGSSNTKKVWYYSNTNVDPLPVDPEYCSCGTNLDYDLVAADVIYYVNEMTGIVTFKALIKNCGKKSWKGTGHAVFGWDTGTYLSEKRIDFNSDYEIRPGESIEITKDLPFASKNKYGWFEILVSVTPDQCTTNNNLILRKNSYVTGEDLKNGVKL